MPSVKLDIAEIAQESATFGAGKRGSSVGMKKTARFRFGPKRFRSRARLLSLHGGKNQRENPVAAPRARHAFLAIPRFGGKGVGAFAARDHVEVYYRVWITRVSTI